MQKLGKKSVISIVLASIFTVATILTCCLLFIPTSPVSLNPDTAPDSTITTSGLNYSYDDSKTDTSIAQIVDDSGNVTGEYVFEVTYSTKYIEGVLGGWTSYNTGGIFSFADGYFFNIQLKIGLNYPTTNNIVCNYIYNNEDSLHYNGSWTFSYNTEINAYFVQLESSNNHYRRVRIILPQIHPTTTLTFYANNGTAATEQTVTCGNQIGSAMPANPTRDGYTFMGWFVDGEQIISNTYYMWDSPKIAFAQWERNTVASSNYTLSSSVNNSSYGTIIGASASYPANTMVAVSAVPTADYEFSYWTINNSYISTANPLQFSISANTTIQAVFEPNSLSNFTVNFSGGGGTYTVEQTDNNYALITITPEAGQYIDSISFDNGLSTKIEYYNGTIVNCGSNVLYATYLTNNNDNKNVLKLSLYYILGSGTINVLTTTNAPTLEENTGGGLNIDGIALKSTTGGEARVVGSGEGTTLVAVNYAGYEFLYWEGSSSGQISTSASYTINEDDYAGEVITAVFSPINNSDLNFDTDSNSDDF